MHFLPNWEPRPPSVPADRRFAHSASISVWVRWHTKLPSTLPRNARRRPGSVRFTTNVLAGGPPRW